MAFGTNRSSGNYSSNKPATQGSSAPRKKIFSTGLFKPSREGVKAVASVQVKEQIIIPAGSYLNLYENDKAGENKPIVTLQVTEGKLKSK